MNKSMEFRFKGFILCVAAMRLRSRGHTYPSAVHLLGTTMVSVEGFSIFLSIPPSSSSSGPNSIGKGKCWNLDGGFSENGLMAWDPGFALPVCQEGIIFWKNCKESQVHYMIFWFTFYAHLLSALFMDLFWEHSYILLIRFYSQLFCEIDVFLIFSMIEACNTKSFWCIFF